jgi:hypothetical protein
MSQKNNLKRLLILGFFSISLGGFLLHLAIHPPLSNPAHWIPFSVGFASIAGITTMYCFKRLVPYAYIVNGMFVIIGTITMFHFSLVQWSGLYAVNKLNISSVFLKGLMADIFILWTAFFIGKAIFDLQLVTVSNLDAARHKGRFFRYPNMGYWGVHLAGLSFVYLLGSILWE